MPMVGEKKFPYTQKGKKEAKKYAMNTNKKVKKTSAKKMKGY